MARGTVIYGKKLRYFVDGKEVTQKVYDKTFPPRPIEEIVGGPPTTLMQTSKSWPRLSDAYGVGKGQKQKAEETMKKLGVPTEYVPDGSGGYSAKILNNEHQRNLLKATGMHNNHGGYGQVTG